MQFIWDTSLESQTSHYINKLSTTASGFFGRVHAIVLPYFNHRYWYVPDLGLMKDPEFRNSIKDLSSNKNYFIPAESKVFKETFQIFRRIKSSNPDNDFLIDSKDAELIEHKKIFQKYEKKIRNFLELMFEDQELSRIRNIIILPTKFGTNGSFGHQYVDKRRRIVDIIANYRLDLFEQLPRNIFTGCMLLKSKYANLGDKEYRYWRDRQAIMDFIGKETRFGKLFMVDAAECKSYQVDNDYATLDMLDSEHGEFAVESARYLASMGYPVKSNFSCDSDIIYYNSNPVTSLSKQQVILMKTLVERHGKIVNFDNIAQVLWKDEWRERFSFDAMSKLVEKTRKALNKNQISPNVLLTVRKQGYLVWG